jgi:hypothetical protein
LFICEVCHLLICHVYSRQKGRVVRIIEYGEATHES